MKSRLNISMPLIIIGVLSTAFVQADYPMMVDRRIIQWEIDAATLQPWIPRSDRG